LRADKPVWVRQMQIRGTGYLIAELRSIPMPTMIPPYVLPPVVCRDGCRWIWIRCKELAILSPCSCGV